jgi:hypothetical protein
MHRDLHQNKENSSGEKVFFPCWQQKVLAVEFFMPRVFDLLQPPCEIATAIQVVSYSNSESLVTNKLLTFVAVTRNIQNGNTYLPAVHGQ